jgi:probable FeS assembly SUF system protein SufT
VSSKHTLSKDTPGTLIPDGQPTTLPAGTTVIVTQTLGGSITVRAGAGLCRIAREHVGHLEGFVPMHEGASPSTASTGSPPAGSGQTAFSENAVWDALKTCYDPEIPVNIVDLGLVYDLSVEPTPAGGRQIEVKMTLTAPGCGMGPVIAEDARARIAALPGVESARVHIVWDPAWTPQMISDDGRKVLGLE